MTFIFIGLTVGIVMGLTGAGGALISIPLFLGLLDSSLKEATVLSLLAVILGTSVNLFGIMAQVNKRIVMAFSFFGVTASFFAAGWKNLLPDLIVAGLLFGIALFSLWSIWNKKDHHESEAQESFLLLTLTGLFLGAVTTFTGLGGGVLLIPILIKFFGKTYEEALPTSLGSILFISLGSFIFQFDMVSELISVKEIGLMLLGSVASYFALKYSLKTISEKTVLYLRKIVFSLVTIYAIGSVILKALGGAE